MILFWLAIGIVSVTYAYLSSPNALDPWGPLNTAGVVAGAYLFALLASTFRSPLSRKIIILGWTIAVLTLGAILSSWMGYDRQSHYQSEVLSEIRGQISRGLIANEISAPLLKSLEAYHAQPAKRRRTLGTIFHDLTQSSVGSNIHRSTYESDQLRIVVAQMSDDEVVLIAQESYVKGRDPNFKNLDGGKGMIQELARLTSKGIRYESHN